MGTRVNSEIKTYDKKPDTPVRAQGFDFSSLNIGDIMLNGSEADKKRLMILMKQEKISPLRAWLNYVKAHNEPIKEEIKLCQEEIHNERRELSTLRRDFRNSNDAEEQALLKEMISETKGNIWDLCRTNVRRAFTLE